MCNRRDMMERQNQLRLFVSFVRKDRQVLHCRKLRLFKAREVRFNLHQDHPHLEFHEAEIFERGLSIQSRCVDFDEAVEMLAQDGHVLLLRYGRRLAPTLRDSKWPELGLDPSLEVWFSNEQVVQYRLPGQSPLEVRATRDRLIQRAFEMKVLCDEDTGAVLADKDRIQLNLKDWNYEVMRHAMYHRKLHMEYLEFQAQSDLQAALPQMDWWLNFAWERQIWTYEHIFRPCLDKYTEKHMKPPSEEILKYFEYLETMKALLAHRRTSSFKELSEVFEQIPTVASLDCFKLYEHFDAESFRWLPADSLEVQLSKRFNAEKFDDLRFGFKLQVNQKQQRITSLEGRTSLIFPTYNEVKALFHLGRSNILIYSPQIQSRDFTYFTYWEDASASPCDSLDLLTKEAKTRANEGHKLLHVASNSEFVYLFTARKLSQENDSTKKNIVVSRYPRAENWKVAVSKASAVLTLRVEEPQIKPHFCFGLNRNRPWVCMSQTEEAESGDKSHLLVVGQPEARRALSIELADLLRGSSLASDSDKRYSKILDASVQLEGFPLLLVHDVGVSQKVSHARVVLLKANESIIHKQLDLGISPDDLASHQAEFIPAKTSVVLLEVLLKEFRYRVTVIGKTAINRICKHFRLATDAPCSIKGFVWIRKERRLVALVEGNCYYKDLQVLHFRLKW